MAIHIHVTNNKIIASSNDFHIRFNPFMPGDLFGKSLLDLKILMKIIIANQEAEAYSSHLKVACGVNFLDSVFALPCLKRPCYGASIWRKGPKFLLVTVLSLWEFL